LAYVAEVLLVGPPETVSWCPANSQEKTSWTGVFWGGNKMWSMRIVFREVIPGLRAGDRRVRLPTVD